MLPIVYLFTWVQIGGLYLYIQVHGERGKPHGFFPCSPSPGWLTERTVHNMKMSLPWVIPEVHRERIRGG